MQTLVIYQIPLMTGHNQVVILHGGTTISWKSCKQTLVAASINHSEIIVLYEASCECGWVHRMIDQKSCRICAIESPMIIYEDNAVCIAQMQMGYIKTNYTKHISPKLFYPHELQECEEISILQIKSYDNLVNLFTKSLPLATFYLTKALDQQFNKAISSAAISSKKTRSALKLLER
jgi:hypothetical protein